MLKITIVTDHYLPGFKAGGPVKSISNLSKNLMTKFRITVLTSNHDFGEINPYTNLKFNTKIKVDNYNVIYLSKKSIYFIYKYLNQLDSDIIYLNSFFSKTTLMILLLKKFNLIKSKIILAPRGELSYGALSIKKLKKNLFLKFCNFMNLYSKIVFHSTDLIEKKDIEILFENKIINIANIPENNMKSFSPASKIKNDLKIIFLSRITKKKNLLFAIKALQQNVFTGKICLDIFGPIEDENYWNECLQLIKITENNVEIKYKGIINPNNVSSIMSKYHAFILPTLNENFGHAIVESMQNGLIPLISNNTPWNEIEKLNLGFIFSLKNDKKLTDSIHKLLAFENSDFLDSSKKIKEYINKKLDYEVIINKYVNALKSL